MWQVKWPETGHAAAYRSAFSPLELAHQARVPMACDIVACRVNGMLRDIRQPIEDDATIEWVHAASQDGLDVIRHSAAHIMAQAVKSLHPEAQVTIGPVIDDGFYYDFACDHTFSQDDLKAITKRMQEIVAADVPITREVWSREKAVSFFQQQGEHYKVEIIQSIPEHEPLSLYHQGDFTDICRGPHVPSTGHVKAFWLQRVSGAYWRGDSTKPMLQRIYGTAWDTQEALSNYQNRLQEAERRDHRTWGKTLSLFHVEESSPGMLFWHPHGWTLYRIIASHIRSRMQQGGYQEIKTPQIMDQDLWERSGHWDKFQEHMFLTGAEDNLFAVKPMSCPGHVLMFNRTPKSWRDLPLRYAEFGACHRREPSGSLHGLMRVRSFLQDDGHVFCQESQIAGEILHFHTMLCQVYADFGFTDIHIKCSTRPHERVGDETLWDKAEEHLQAVLDSLEVPWTLQPGEGAFYGPKIEYALKDAIGRVWQLGTIQLDFSMPLRLGATYVGTDGNKHTPVMLHRAILGSMERFIGILIEHHAGSFPFWLAPCQAKVLTVADRHKAYAEAIAKHFLHQGYRLETDTRNEKIGFKIREHTLKRVPYLLVVGDKEVDSNTLAVRRRTDDNLGVMSWDDLKTCWQQEQYPDAGLMCPGT